MQLPEGPVGSDRGDREHREQKPYWEQNSASNGLIKTFKGHYGIAL